MQIQKHSKKILVAEVGRHSLSICLPDMKEVAVLNFPENTIVDMEIVNTEELKQLVNSFLEGLKLAKTEIILMVHDSLCFEVNLSGLTTIEQDLKYNSFLETVPLESVIARKVIVDDKNAFGVAINRLVYEFFHQTFLVWGLDINVAVPAVVVKSLGYEGQLSGKVCLLLAKKVKLLKQWSFFEDRLVTDKFAKKQRHFIEKHKVVAGVVSTVFVAIALVTSVLTLRVSTPPPKVIPVVAKDVSLIPTTTPVVEPTPIPKKTSELVSTVGSTVSNRNSAQLVRSELIRLGLTKVELLTASSAADLTQVGFSTKVAQADKISIVEYLRKLFSEVVETTIESTDIDVEIVVGKTR